MKNLTEYLNESLETEVVEESKEDTSVEAILMLLNRWDGKPTKVCELPAGADGKAIATELSEIFNSDEELAKIEWCDDCKCVKISPVDFDGDDFKEVKYAEMFKEAKEEIPAPGMEMIDYNDEDWICLDVVSVEDNESDYEKLLKNYDNGSMKEEFKTLADLKKAGYKYAVAAEYADDDRMCAVFVFCNDGLRIK